MGRFTENLFRGLRSVKQPTIILSAVEDVIDVHVFIANLKNQHIPFFKQ